VWQAMGILGFGDYGNNGKVNALRLADDTIKNYW